MTNNHEYAMQNLIEEAKMDGFDLPFYDATAEEVREIIKEEGSFSVEKFESTKTRWDGSSPDDDEGCESFKDDYERGESVTKCLRAAYEPFLKAHFGEEIMDEIFVRFKNKVIQFWPELVFPSLVLFLI